MTHPMTDSEVCDLIDATSGALADAVDRIEALEKRVKSLESDTPHARQMQHELDITLADNAAAGYADDYHGGDCQCPYCATDEDTPDTGQMAPEDRKD